MRLFLFFLHCIIPLLGTVSARAQETNSSQLPPAESHTEPLLGVKQMHDDLQFMREKILAQHVHPYLYIKEKSFDRLYRNLNKGIDKPMDKLEFYRRSARLAASLKDGHTLVDPLIGDFQSFAKTNGVFPLEVTFLSGRLYVDTNSSANPDLKRGVEITSINSNNIPTIVEDYRGLINDVHPLYDIYSRLFRELYWLRYGNTKQFVITFQTEGGTHGRATVSAHIFPPEAFHSYQSAGSAHKFEVLRSGHVGLLTINSFSPSEDFDAFLEQTFATLQERGTKTLIIDVRRNGGGSGRLAQEVVSYLTDRPYNFIGAFYVKVTQDLKDLYQLGTTHTDEDTRQVVMNNPVGSFVNALEKSGPVVIKPQHRNHLFHGTVYLLTANNTLSAAAMFAAMVKCNHLGTVVGEEPGQSTKFVADGVPFTMPNSGLTFSVSFSEIHMPCDQSYEHGILPDYPITSTRKTLVAGEDAALGFTLNLIKTKSVGTKKVYR